MRQIAIKFAVGMVFAAIGMFGAADNSLGTWERNIAKSKTSGQVPNPYTSQTQVREAVDGGVKVTMTGTRKDGTAVKGGYTAKYDGAPVPATGTANYDTISVKQINADTLSFDTKKTGTKYHVTGRTVVSKDGKTLTTTGKGVGDDGKPMTLSIVYNKK